MEAPRPETIAILGKDPEEWKRAEDVMQQGVPGAAISELASLDQLREFVHSSQTDLVIIDQPLALRDIREFMYELKNNDSQPWLVVLSEQADPQVINELYKYGCQRFILKDGRWINELALSVRHLLRFRHVVEENEKIRSRLTEANMLLDERNRRLDEFSATLAHDIRGPLGSVSMKIEYLLEHHNKGLDQRSAEILSRALNSCRRLTDTVQTMYEFAKLGSKATKKQLFDLSDLVNSVISDLNYDTSLDIELALGELPELWGNKELLGRVFQNLISNAIKYNDKKEIKIKVECQGTVRRGMGLFARIVISDNGPGIDEAELKEIFTMFRRGATSKDAKDGAGVGLAVVERIVELHFGEVQIASKLGEGTSFCLILPAEPMSVEG